MKPARTPKSRWWLWPFGLAVFAVAALSLLRWMVQPERLGRFLLERAETESGLDLKVSGPPRLGIWPRLHLQLSGLEVRDPALPGELLASADNVALYLPLASLRGDIVIDAVSLQAPRFDLAALRRRSAQQMGPPAAPWIPPIASLEVSEGSLVDEGWALESVDLELEHLLDPTRDLQLEIQGLLEREGDSPLPLRMALTAGNPPGEALEWPLRAFKLGDHDAALLQAPEGHLTLPDWTSPRLRLIGKLIAWPGDWPALPEPARDQLPGLDLELRFAPADPDASVQLWLAGPGRRAHVAIQPDQLADWLAAGDWLAQPPGSVRLELESLELEGVRIEGLKLEHGADGSR